MGTNPKGKRMDATVRLFSDISMNDFRWATRSDPVIQAGTPPTPPEPIGTPQPPRLGRTRGNANA